MRNIIAVLSAVTVFYLIFLCEFESRADSISEASKKIEKKAEILPPLNPDYAVTANIKGIDGYFVKYDARFYRGGDIVSIEGVQYLKKLGIQTVISISPSENERKILKEGGITLVELPFEQSGLNREIISRFLETVNKSDGSLYVHCHSGKHRGGILGYIYRVKISGWQKDRALIEFARLGGDLKDDHQMITLAEN
jgi:protein tyrosine phosphatase (PTP) superfamily phosphohydrolase (DUF442 family)